MTKKLAVILACLSLSFVAVSPSDAGTKWQTNLVPESDTDPTVIEKSKISFKDKGQLKASIQGLTDGAGMLVTTDTSFKDNKILNGDEYFVIVSGNFPALSVPFEFNLPFEVKAGKGSGKGDFSTLFSFIPPGTHRASEMTSVKVVGPLGAANILDCFNNVTAGGGNGGFVVLGATNPCDHGDLIAVGGVLIP